MKELVTEFAEEKRKERALEAARGRRKKGYAGTVVAAVACLGAWFAPLPKPGGQPAPVAERFTMASGRMTLTLAARRIESFRDQYRHLPTTLADAGVNEPDMQYSHGSAQSFSLQLLVGSTTLSFDSSMAPAIFADDAKTILETGR